MNTLKQLLTEVNSIGFWGRIFGWNRIKRLLVDSFTELQSLINNLDLTEKKVIESSREIDQLRNRLQSTEQRVTDLQHDKDVMEVQLEESRRKVGNFELQFAKLKQADENRHIEHQKSIQTFTELKTELQEDRRREVAKQKEEQEARFEQLKETWHRHQVDTKNKIRLLCEKHTIQYVDKVPFRGEPDNTIEISKEYVVFDAKSPANDNLTNFPTYLRTQAEAASKYADKENVRTDIFFVVPTNTLPELTTTTFVFAKHRVFVIPTEALEPVFLSLKKIEEYDFAEQLSPEDRENICRAIGRFLHFIKRRLQVDNFFSKEALAIAGDCETLLPAEIIEEMMKIERAIIMNPPQERGGKEISLSVLQKETRQVEKGLEEKGVITGQAELAKGLNALPLYNPKD